MVSVTVPCLLPVSNRVHLPVDMPLFWCILLGMRKKKHRKVYSLINPIVHAIEGAAINYDTVESTLTPSGEKSASTRGKSFLCSTELWPGMPKLNTS